MSAVPMSGPSVAGQEVYEMEVEAGFLPKVRDWTAWGTSFAVHLAVLIVLGLIHFEVLRDTETAIDSSIAEEEVEPIVPTFDTSVMDQIGNNSSVNTLSASQDAASKIGEQDLVEEVRDEVESPLEMPVPITTEDIPQPERAEFASVIETRGATEHPGGVEGAVDRLAWEISNTLREGKTLVVWAFDVSPSLAKRRAAIADRVENVYNQLNSLNVGADKALLTGVISFSDKTTFITKEPVSDTADVVKAVREIRSEESGTENVFSAVHAAAKHWLPYRQKMHRQMMIIVVTDERGSDAPQALEETIALTKRYGIRCYVVGDAAPFGRETTEAPFTLESGEEIIGVMENGPETLHPDLVRLPYWGVNGWDLDRMSSGFGPYALTRLAAETNGLYLIANESGRHRFDPQIMRTYTPDYRPIKFVDNDVMKNAGKRNLVQVARMSMLDALPVPQTEFPADNDTVLRQAITEAQKPQAVLDYKLAQISQLLEAGEKDRAKIAQPRWQVAYDLAMGRILALRVRSFGYNLMLADMKVNPKKFEKQGSNRWRLVSSNDVNSGQAVKKMAAKANEYLNRVIDEHPGTPWQVMAEREKSAAFGWEWREETYTAPPAGAGGGERKKQPRFIEEIDPKTGKKTKRQLPDQPVRRQI